MNKFVKPILNSLLISSIGIMGLGYGNQAFAETQKDTAKTHTTLQQVENFSKESNSVLQSLITTNEKLKLLNTMVYIVSYDKVTKNQTYTVAEGDTVQSIADKFGLNETMLIKLNDLKPKTDVSPDTEEMQFDIKVGQEVKLGTVTERLTKEIFLNKKDKITDEIKKENLKNATIESTMSNKKYQEFKKASMSSEIKDKIQAQIGIKDDGSKVVDLDKKQTLLEQKLKTLRETERKKLMAQGLSYKEAIKKQLANEDKQTSFNTDSILIAKNVDKSLAQKYSKSLKYAESLLGVPYVFGGTSEFGIDCSGYIYRSYNAGGISVPRTTAEGFYNMSDKISNPAVGDLVFFANTYKAGISHIGIYIGNGKMINAGGDYVHIADITKGYWAEHFAGFGRLSKLK